MRPRTLDEMVGQKEILGPGKILRRAVEADRLFSLVLYGPPGSGKTTLAEVIANTTDSCFERLSAVTAGVADLRRVIAGAETRLAESGRRTVLLLDEIHRFNKAQQDVLLPFLEKGAIVLIGATTENPFFSVNSALISRTRLMRLSRLTEEEIGILVARALQDSERGLGGYHAELEAAAMDFLVQAANGDARIALNALELAVIYTQPGPDGHRRITLTAVEEGMGRRALAYDRLGDQHYDVVSAFIKSLRGSDINAGLHYLVRMLAAGEDARFIARRMVILASEDVGLADPNAMLIAEAAARAVEYVGLPEAELPLAEAVIYLAGAPKSNSVKTALARAKRDLTDKPLGEVPAHLRDSSYRGARKLGHGVDYKYPHDYPGHRVDQQYLPDALTGSKYYEPSDLGWEGRRWQNASGKQERRR